jgi:hypothetical protein
VLVYKKLNTSFQAMVQGRSFDGYQSLYQQTTSEFAVISSNINAVEKELLHERHNGVTTQICRGIRNLQQLEKKKLLVTAHSQAMDLKDCLGVEVKGIGDAGYLFETVESHRSAVFSLVESINEVLEEIQCEASDL